MSDVSFSILRGKGDKGRLMERIRKQNYFINKKNVSDAILKNEIASLHNAIDNLSYTNPTPKGQGKPRKKDGKKSVADKIASAVVAEVGQEIKKEVKKIIEASESRESEPSTKKKRGRISQGKSTPAQLRARAKYSAKKKELKKLIESLD